MADSKLNLYQRLIAAQVMIGHIEPTGSNPSFKYAFTEESEVVRMVAKAFAGVGVVFTASVLTVIQTPEKTASDRPVMRSLVHMAMRFTNADDKSDAVSFDWWGEALDSGDKGVNKAIVAAVKYALLKNLLIPKAGDDAEADAVGDGVQPAAAPRPQRAAAPAPTTAPAPAPTDGTKAPEAPAKGSGIAEDAERKDAREGVYSLLKELGLDASAASIRRYASEALNRDIKSLYELKTADDWNVVRMYIFDNYGHNPAAGGDSDIPF